MKHIKNKPELSAHQRIIRAAINGTGIRLSPDQVVELARDHAVEQAAFVHSVWFQNCTDWSYFHTGFTPGVAYM